MEIWYRLARRTEFLLELLDLGAPAVIVDYQRQMLRETLEELR